EIFDVPHATDAFVEVLFVPILAGQEAVREPIEGDDAHSLCEGGVAQLAFELGPFDHIVPGLKDRGLQHSARDRRVHGLTKPGGGELRKSDGAYFAGFREIAHGAYAVDTRDGLTVML